MTILDTILNSENDFQAEEIKQIFIDMLKTSAISKTKISSN